MQQVMRSGAAASVVRTPLAIALLVAVVAPVRPALAINFIYAQNANGQEFSYHLPACCLAFGNWPNNNNWSQEKQTFVDARGDTIVSAPTNWTTPEGPIDYYPGSPNDPNPAAERHVFLDSFTVSGDANATIRTLNMSSAAMLSMASGKSLTITDSLNMSGGSILNMVGGTLTFGDNSHTSLNISSGSILNMLGGTLIIGDNSTITSLNISPESILNLASGSSLSMHGAINNDGTISLETNPNGNAITDLKIADGTTLTGSGRVVLGGPAGNRIYGVTGNEELINSKTPDATHTISGGGQLGMNLLKLTNQGLIDANIAAKILYINPNASGVTNTGTIQASFGGIVRLQDGTFNNTLGVIQALNGSQVQLGFGSTVVGGTLSSSGSGKIVVEDDTFDGTTFSILSGTITNNGLVALESGGNLRDLKITDGTTLIGSGSLVLGGHVNNRIYGVTTGNEELINGKTLTETHTISGGGQLGANLLKVTNQGLIDANLAAKILYINPSAAGVTNTGIIQASEGGIVRLQDGTFTNTGGVIQALDGSQVQLGDGSTVVGGTLSSSDSGKIVVEDFTFSGNTFSILSGTITNNGLVALESGGNLRDLKITDGTTLNGSGRVVLGGHANNRIYGVTTGSEELINGQAHTISGGGRLGNNSMKLTNQGLIDANIAATTLYVDPSASGATNTGIIQASDGGIMRLQDGTFTNTGGVIQALDGSLVQLNGTFTNTGGVIQALDGSQVQLEGGTFTNTGGVIQALNDSLVQLSNISLVGGTLSRGGTGQVVVPNNTTLTLTGPITLNAPLEINSTGSVTNLKINGNVTLSGSENVVLSNRTSNRISGVNATDVLTLSAGQTIAGAGQIGFNLMGLVNEGTIDANVSSPLTIDPSSAGVTNTGILQASNNATLNLTGGTFTNTGGLIQALEGSLVQLSNMSLVGGTLSRGGAGPGAGRIVVPNNTTLTLSGPITLNPITLNAPLEIYSTGSVTNLKINGNVTLSGSENIENVVLSNNTNNRISGVTATDVLTLSAGRTIAGAGQIGFNLMGLVNEGTIDANVSSPLTIDPSSAGVTNTGILQASGAGGLILTGGTFTNTGGVIQAINGSQVQVGGTVVGGTLKGAGTGLIANDGILRGSGPEGLQLTGGTFRNWGIVEALDGSHVTYSSSAVEENSRVGVLIGGTWRSIATGGGATITLPGSSDITVIRSAAQVVLSGAGSVLRQITTPLESTLTTNQGKLRILDGRAFTMTHALDNLGTIELGGSDLADASISTPTLTLTGAGWPEGPGGILLGHGTVVGNVLNSSGNVVVGNVLDASGGQSFDASIGTLHVIGDYTQSRVIVDEFEWVEGTLQIELASTLSFDKLAVSGSASLDGSLYVALIDDFQPLTGDYFADILSAASVAGAFGNFYGTDLGGGMLLNPISTATSLSLLTALPGDANLDTVAEFTDLGILLNNYNVSGFSGIAQWNAGDFNDDHSVDFIDLGILLNNYNQHAPLLAVAAPVPEPSTLALAALGILGLLNAARRKR